jgi:hypothetical protein
MLWNYYVTARHGKRAVALLGPYETHAEAIENVERGSRLAINYDQTGRAAFADYGTARIAGTVKVAFS